MESTNEPMTFEDVLWTLQHNARGGFVEVSIYASPAGEDTRALIAHFSGELASIGKSLFRDDEIDVRIQLSETHKMPHGRIALRRSIFQRAEEKEHDDIPWRLTIWQRGVRIAFDIYGPAARDTTSEEELDLRNDGPPF
jgi:hypothetical protein